MEVFWALENADDMTLAFFGAMILIVMFCLFVAVMVDVIINRKNGKS